MNPVLLALLILSVVVALGGYFYCWIRSRDLPDVSDEEFLRGLADYKDIDREILLRERRRVGGILGIPPIKLAPTQELSALAKRFEYLGQFSVGWSDLDDEVREYRLQATPSSTESLPKTIGELVGELAAGRVSLN